MGLPRIETVGRYELLIELAKGGMAELYLGRLHGVGGFTKLVAIKRILPHLAEDKLFVEMFLNEGRIAAHLSHPNVCAVHELGESDGNLFLAMEYLDGVSWDALIKSQPRTPPGNEITLRLVAGVIAQASEGLNYAHELRDHDGTPTPIVHRDVSPQNLFVTTDGVCKVLDFGVSKMHKDGPRTRTGVLKGKLPYMSPEQIQGEQVDARSDVFALGVVVWEALTGTSLFDRDTDFLIWKAITEAPIPPLAPYGYPPEIDAVLASALARDKDQRFRSARAFGEALRHAASRVGGAYDPDEIATALKAACGERITKRSQQVAAVVTQRRSEPTLDPSPSDTLEDEAASTTSLAKAGESGADSTVSLRSAPVRIQRESRDHRDTEIDQRPRRRWPLVAASLVALTGGVALVLAVMRGGDDTPASPPVAVEPTATDKLTAAAPKIGQAVEVLDKLVEMRPKLEKLRDSVEDIPGATDGWTGSAIQPTPVDEKPTKPVKPPKTKPAVVPSSGEPGTFAIDSTGGAYAKIYIDGKYVDDTPLQTKLPAGKHTVRAVNSFTNQEKTFSIRVEPGKTLNGGKLTW